MAHRFGGADCSTLEHVQMQPTQPPNPLPSCETALALGNKGGLEMKKDVLSGLDLLKGPP